MALGLLSLPLVSLFGAPKRDPSKNRETGRALALGGRGLIMITNNQPIVGGSGRGDVWVVARGWESVWGDTVPSFEATIQMIKTNIYEIHRCLWMAPNRQRLTQQPNKNRRRQQREVWMGGVTSGRRMGNVIQLFGQKIEQQRKKDKEIHHGFKRPQTNHFPHNNQP